MAWIDPRAQKYLRRRFTRADAYRLAPPGSPEAKMPGWLDPSATRVRLKEAQEEEVRARAAAAQEEFEREVAALRESHQRVRIMLADVKFELALRALGRKYSENQPRVPAGSREGGRWIGAFTMPSQQTVETAPSRPTVLAQPGFGRLVAEIPVPGGRRCVYNFGVISVAMPGAANFRCSPRMHWSGATHGTLLNDN
ncbi:MAG: hypothetical protein QOF14_1009 [Hyphomicrobiales bacterium]|jgi:hypothetical protein|nr:hypothetical protein [Hyphomicrobiales bacterium]